MAATAHLEGKSVTDIKLPIPKGAKIEISQQYIVVRAANDEIVAIMSAPNVIGVTLDD
jgi:hypothetical protein